MATIPPWISVNPSDFVQAMQSGAAAGLQLAGLRQRGQLESQRMAQAAAEAAARREQDAAQSAANLDFQRWAQEQNAQRAALALAQQERVAQGQLAGRTAADLMRHRMEMARSAATEAHHKAMQETAKGRLELEREKLNRPIPNAFTSRYHITTTKDGQVVAVDKETGETIVMFPKADTGPAPQPGNLFEPGPLPLMGENPMLPGVFNVAPAAAPGPFDFSRPGGNLFDASTPPPPSAEVERYTFRDNKLSRVK